MSSRGAGPERATSPVPSLARDAPGSARASVGGYADAVVEAGWLAALVVVPLFFSPFSDRAFEPAKVAIVRSLAGVMCAAWLVSWLASHPTGRSKRSSGSGRGNLLAVPVLLLLAANGLATAASISIETSIVGAYERSQGLYTIGSYIAIFFVVADRMRSLRQVERAITAALVASFPVALYGILQRYGLDPLPPDPIFGEASASTLGNPGFLGGYLAIVAPLALMRLVGAVGEAAEPPGARSTVPFGAAAACLAALVLGFGLGVVAAAGAVLLVLAGWLLAGMRARRASAAAADGSSDSGETAPFLLVALYSILLAAQVSALLASDTRGPALGLLGAMCVFVCLHALLHARARLLAGSLVAGALAVGLVVALHPAGTRAHNETSANPTADVRKQIWEAAVELAVPHDALWSAETGFDRLRAVRPLLGYGPDSFYAASGHVLSPELGVLQGRTARPDHAHNETLDTLVESGAIGLVAYLLLLGTVLYLALASLGVVTSGQRRTLALACAAGAVLTALLVVAIFGRAFTGLAVPAGMVGGTAIWLARRATQCPPPPVTRREALLVAVLAALTAHVIETQLSVAATTALTYFWILTAVVVVLARPDRGVRSDPAADAESLAMVPLVSALVLATLVFGFVNATTLGALPSDSTLALLVLAGASVAVVIGLHLAEIRRAASRSGILRTLAIVATATLTLLFAFSGPFLFTVERSDDGDLSALLAGLVLFLAFVVAVVLLLGAALSREHRAGRAASGLRVGGGLAAATLLAGLSLWVNGRIAEADIVHEQAPPLSGSDQLVRRFEAAGHRQPLHDRALVFLADAHLRRAQWAAGRELTGRELERAERALLRARRLNPFDGDHTLELALLQERAAKLGGPAVEVRDRFDRALRYYAEATRMSPRSAYVRDARAHALLEYSSFLTRGGDPSGVARLRREARRQLHRSYALDPEYCLTLALRALAGRSWMAMTTDALASVDPHRGPCGGDGLERRFVSFAARALAHAGELARAAGDMAAFLGGLRTEARARRRGLRSQLAARALRDAQGPRAP